MEVKDSTLSSLFMKEVCGLNNYVLFRNNKSNGGSWTSEDIDNISKVLM
jgi:hypothetical protein